MENKKIVIVQGTAVLTVDYNVSFTVEIGEAGGFMLRMFGKTGMTEVFVPPSALLEFAELIQSAAAHAAAEKLRQSEGAAKAPSAGPFGFPGLPPADFNGGNVLLAGLGAPAGLWPEPAIAPTKGGG